MIELVAAAAAGATAWATWLIDRRRSRRRNRRGCCAACGLTWEETRSDDPHLIHGRLVCASCAETGKRRIVWHFLTLVAAMCVATGSILVVKGLVALALVPVGTTVLMTVGAVRRMTRANRDAQWRIVTGDFPDFGALRAPADVRALEGPTA